MSSADPDSQPRPPVADGSLADRLALGVRDLRRRLGARRAHRRSGGTAPPPATRADWLAALALALLLAAGPLATLVIARQLAADAHAQAARIDAELAPRRAAAAAAARARDTLHRALRAPTLGATLESVARVLPADALLVRTERDAAGALALDVRTPDPDRLRAALRRAPELARLREAGQAREDGAMRVSLKAPAP